MGILSWTPEGIFCPLCGKMHRWEGKNLKSHDVNNKYKYSCKCGGKQVDIEIWHEDKYIYIESTMLCDRVNDKIFGKTDVNLIKLEDPISILGFVIVDHIPLITSIITDDAVNQIACENHCEFYETCNVAIIGNNYHWNDSNLKLEFIISFHWLEADEE